MLIKQWKIWYVPALWISALPEIVQAQELSTDPQGSGVIVAAARWLQGTLLGTVATV